MADWIKVRSGILEPKHRKAMGAAIYLYLYMLDKAEWEDGTIYNWTDKQAADDLEMPIVTLRSQRRHLENELYIKTVQEYNGLKISISKFSNPKEGVKKLTGGVNKLTGGVLKNDQGGYSKVNTASILPDLNTTLNIDSKKISGREVEFLDSLVSLFGGKDFDNELQWRTTLELRKTHGDEKVFRVFKYYALQGKRLGQAVASVVNAIDNWNDRKPTAEPVKQLTPEELAEYVKELK